MCHSVYVPLAPPGRFVLVMRNFMHPLMVQFYKQTIAQGSITGCMFGQQQFSGFRSSSSEHSQETSDTDGTGDSELQQFKQEPSVSRNSKTIVFKKHPSPVNAPLRMTLATTNKKLFGPLLETSQEKKRRLKREARGIDEDECSEKRRKKPRREKMLRQPGILHPRNYHLSFSGKFPEETFHSSYAEDKNGRVTTKNLKRIIINSDSVSSVVKKREDREFDKLSIISDSTYMSNEEDLNSSARLNSRKTLDSTVDNIEDHQTIPGDMNSIYTDHGRNISFLSSIVDQRVRSSSENGKLQSFISIDTSTFSGVPETLDLREIENFPLDSDFVPREPNVPGDEAQGDQVISIGMHDGGYQKLPSVRKILKATMPLSSKIALEKWEAKMKKDLGEEGFAKYREELLERGRFLHECIHCELFGTPLSEQHTASVKKLWLSLMPVLKNVSDIQVLESRLIHPHLYYQGVVDCVGSYWGEPILIEWKTAHKPKLSLKMMYDDPLQVVAYLGAMNFDSKYRLRQPINSAMLVVANENGLPAHVHRLTEKQCYHYWKIWCYRLSQFWKQQIPKAALEE